MFNIEIFKFEKFRNLQVLHYFFKELFLEGIQVIFFKENKRILQLNYNKKLIKLQKVSLNYFAECHGKNDLGK